ncbi:MAG TPA: hypothetical protein VGL10_04660 [Gammaproteobacteria bacterium]
MKKLIYLTFLPVALSAYASNPPLSGTFSNVQNSDTGGFKTSMKNKINLVVTINQDGQQFFIQCFKEDKAGFGVTTLIKTPRLIAKINAGPECPASEVQVELGYENAAVRTDSGWIYLPRGNIHVPLE